MKKKILFINGHLDTGGVEKALLDTLTHLDYEKYDVDLLLTEHTGDYAAQLPPQVHVLLRSIEGTYGSFPKVVLRCLKERDWFSLKMRLIFLAMHFFGERMICLAQKSLLGNRSYDCVIGYRRGLCTQIASHAVKAKKRITWWHHGSVNTDPALYLAQVQKMDVVVAVSENCCRMLTEAMPALTPRLITIHNMMDAAQVKEKSLRFQPYFSQDCFRIVSVGGLAPEKHFENAIYAARELKKHGIAFQWHLVGDGILRQELQRQAAEMDVKDCFLFEGNQINPYPYIRHADLFVHPSYVESFGIVVTEALALGVPCVVTKSTGVMNFLKDGENARLTDPSPESLTEKVLEVLENDVLRAHLKQNARCPEQFLPEAVMNKIEQLLES